MLGKYIILVDVFQFISHLSDFVQCRSFDTLSFLSTKVAFELSGLVTIHFINFKFSFCTNVMLLELIHVKMIL